MVSWFETILGVIAELIFLWFNELKQWFKQFFVDGNSLIDAFNYFLHEIPVLFYLVFGQVRKFVHLFLQVESNLKQYIQSIYKLFRMICPFRFLWLAKLALSRS